MKRLQRYLLLFGTVAALVTVAGFVIDPGDFFRSYLFVFLFCLGLSLGCLANLMLHEVTGGRWGVPLRAPMTAAARLVPLNILLFVPLLFGLPFLYHWMGSTSTTLASKHWWLNEPGFLVRAGLYLLVWSVFAWRWIVIAGRAGEIRPPALRRLSAVGLIVYGLTVSLASVDWIMSLMPQWYSTTFGLLIGTSQMLSGLALGVVACAFLDARTTDAGRFADFGNLLLTYVMTWAYLAFTQYLIIWAEDLPKETDWYIPRVQTSWRWLTLTVFVLQFALPFAVLLFRVVKRAPRFLGPLALLLLCGALLFDFYLVTPVLKPKGFAVAWSDPVVMVAVLGLWAAAWLRSLRRSASGAMRAAS